MTFQLLVAFGMSANMFMWQDTCLNSSVANVIRIIDLNMDVTLHTP